MPAKKANVYIDWSVYQKMSYWAKLGGKKGREFTCFARTVLHSQSGDHYFWISDAYLVKHEGNSSAVEIDEDDMAALMFRLDQAGIPPDEAFRCWVHSHPGTGPSATYLSGTDEGNIQKFMQQGTDWLVSIVFDSRGENPYTRVDFRSPIHHCMEADLEVVYPVLDADTLKSLEEEFEAKSRPKVHVYTGKGSRSYMDLLGTGGYLKGQSHSSGASKTSEKKVVGFSGKTTLADLYGNDVNEDDFWRRVEMEYHEADDEGEMSEVIIGFEDMPEVQGYEDEGEHFVYDSISLPGSRKIDVDLEYEDEDFPEDMDVFSDCVESISNKIQIGHITPGAGLSSLIKMGYSESASAGALAEELGVSAKDILECD